MRLLPRLSASEVSRVDGRAAVSGDLGYRVCDGMAIFTTRAASGVASSIHGHRRGAANGNESPVSWK